MVIDRKGVTRIVILIGNYAFKIPNFTVCWLHFLQGCYANWSERDYYKKHSKVKYENNLSEFVAPSYFCLWFGLLQIQARCLPKQDHLTEQEIEYYKDLHNGDFKKENFGYYNSKLVCLDYP